MDFTFTSAEEAWREEVRDFLDKELPPDKGFNHEFTEDEELWEFALQFTRKVGEKGWIGLTWPKEYGGLGRSLTERLIMAEEFALRDAPMVNMIGYGLAAGTLLVGGTEEQKKRFLPEIARFDRFWAEGLSEPGAGSDLASLTTRAVHRGSDWVVNGQKTYTTWGHRADVMYLAARTDPDAPRHQAISIFCVDLKSPGVSFSRLDNLGGGRQNHTYFDNVRIPGDMLLGEVGKGWSYIMNAFYQAAAISARYCELQRMLDLVVDRCRTATRGGRPALKDPIVRSKLAELALMVDTERLLAYEALGDARNHRQPAYAGALGIVVHKEHQPRFAQLINQIVGPLCQLTTGTRWAPINGDPEAWYRASYANHAGGTSQVKRMVLATRGLGLPR
ncbi:alkylation response protein AidB-like acyl-CoA dehydrogenase [Streptosporangium album]|uniref:Alkylation response protein AidB-like acyl-CoA dehydrogenase n=1 Tax=Streptosporangium album TaxID=47479 RepID=A0A7W7WEJ3_9ACTN|nr:acyl-CoA dehydrogenase family protein [Streptosporangium album]MBB4944191.1 alkylation response protein AidB-like acyl-CoA dehydrogenase [Streptosporangium album]